LERGRMNQNPEQIEAGLASFREVAGVLEA
jgi:hypothetical protein